MPADSPAAGVFLRDVAYEWPSLAEARARFSPVAELADGSSPSRIVTLKEFKGAVIIPPGSPRIVGNVWLTYPGRRHVVTARSNTLLFDRDDNPAWGICEWVFLAVDPDERATSTGPSRTTDRTPLVVDGAERQTWHYESDGLICRAARVDGRYYAAISPADQPGQPQLVTR